MAFDYLAQQIENTDLTLDEKKRLIHVLPLLPPRALQKLFSIMRGKTINIAQFSDEDDKKALAFKFKELKNKLFEIFISEKKKIARFFETRQNMQDTKNIEQLIQNINEQS